MIRAIGFQKALGLFLMLTLLVVLAGYWIYVLQPSIKTEKRQLAMNVSEVSEITENLDLLIKGINQFDKQKSVFERIKKLGFFDPQSRPETRQRINAMQLESRLLAAKYNINPAETEPNEKAKEAGYKILNTDINFSLEAIEDTDIYKFIYLLNYGFPGQIKINTLNIKRGVEVTQPVLRQIGLKESGPLVTAVLNVNWRTMVPDSSLSVNVDEEGQN